MKRVRDKKKMGESEERWIERVRVRDGQMVKRVRDENKRVENKNGRLRGRNFHSLYYI